MPKIGKEEIIAKLKDLGLDVDPTLSYAQILALFKGVDEPKPVEPEKVEEVAPVAEEVLPEPVGGVRIMPENQPVVAPVPFVLPGNPAFQSTLESVTGQSMNEWRNKKTMKLEQRFRMLERTDHVDIVKFDGTYVRTYEKAIHGENYLKLAKQLCDKQNSMLV